MLSFTDYARVFRNQASWDTLWHSLLRHHRNRYSTSHRCCVCRRHLETEGSCYVKDGFIYCKEDYFRCAPFLFIYKSRCIVGKTFQNFALKEPTTNLFEQEIYFMRIFKCENFNPTSWSIIKQAQSWGLSFNEMSWSLCNPNISEFHHEMFLLSRISLQSLLTVLNCDLLNNRSRWKCQLKIV